MEDQSTGAETPKEEVISSNPFFNENVKRLERDENFVYLQDKINNVLRFAKESPAIEALKVEGWVEVSFPNWYMGLSGDTRKAIEEGRAGEVL